MLDDSKFNFIAFVLKKDIDNFEKVLLSVCLSNQLSNFMEALA